MNKKQLVFIFMILTTVVSAQDIHFSQFGNVPFYYNPSRAGFMSEQYRLSANSKIQWNSVTAPYQTYLAGADIGFQRKGSFLGKFGMGVDFMREKAGDGGFGTSGLGCSFSYIKALNNFNSQFVSIGASARMHQRSFDPSALTFISQYNSLYYDPLIPSDETFSEISFWYPVVGVGTSYLYHISSQQELSAGLSALNINRPRQSHFNDNTVKLCTRWVADVSWKTAVGRSSTIVPSAFFSLQGVFRELVFGADYRYVKNYNPWDYRAFSGGLFYRVQDGFILVARFDYLNYRIGISYDINTSKLTPASHLRGGFEFSLVAVFNKPEHRTNREIPCPIF